jgi:hypothetical protein
MAFYHFSAFQRNDDIKSHGRPSILTPIQIQEPIRYFSFYHQTLDDCQDLKQK